MLVAARDGAMILLCVCRRRSSSSFAQVGAVDDRQVARLARPGAVCDAGKAKCRAARLYRLTVVHRGAAAVDAQQRLATRRRARAADDVPDRRHCAAGCLWRSPQERRTLFDVVVVVTVATPQAGLIEVVRDAKSLHALKADAGAFDATLRASANDGLAAAAGKSGALIDIMRADAAALVDADATTTPATRNERIEAQFAKARRQFMASLAAYSVRHCGARASLRSPSSSHRLLVICFRSKIVTTATFFSIRTVALVS